MTINDVLFELVEGFASTSTLADLATEDVSALTGADIKETLKLLGVKLAAVLVEIQSTAAAAAEAAAGGK